MTSNTAQNPTAAAPLSPQSSVLSTSPLPPLSPAEAKTLSAFLENPSLGAASAELRILPTEMLRFLSLPHIAAYLALAKQLVADRDCLDSVGVLREVMAIPENTPAERRRAASTILRFYQSAAKLAAQPAEADRAKRDPRDQRATTEPLGTQSCDPQQTTDRAHAHRATTELLGAQSCDPQQTADRAQVHRATTEPLGAQSCTSAAPTTNTNTNQASAKPRTAHPQPTPSANSAATQTAATQQQPATTQPRPITQSATTTPHDAHAAHLAHSRQLMAAAT